MSDFVVNLPLTEETVRSLKAGDRVFLSGVLYTGRDDAHMHLVSMIRNGETLPIELENQCIYYVGPCPAKPGQAIGSAGPTTSGRMDSMAPLLMDHGLRGMIGKGLRSAEVIESMKKNCAVYFAAIGGAGALLAKSVTKADVVAFPELGPEAIYRLEVENFPVIVVIDKDGNNLYETAIKEFCEE
jgi:fumarate hydratase subunit beta